MERKALEEARPVVKPDADQGPARLVADQDLQPAAARSRLLRLDDLPGDHRALSERSLGHRPRRPAILVPPGKIQEQVSYRAKAFRLQLLGDGRADAAKLDDRRREGVGGSRGRGRLFGHAREFASRP